MPGLGIRVHRCSRTTSRRPGPDLIPCLVVPPRRQELGAAHYAWVLEQGHSRRAEQRAFVFEQQAADAQRHVERLEGQLRERQAAPPSALRKLLTDLVCFHPDRNPEGLGGDVTKELLAVRARL